MTRPGQLYAVGDIHGHLDSLHKAMSLIEADGGPDAPIIFLGDFVDRGPDSRGVVQTLLDGHEAGRNWRFVLGNHDRMFLTFVGMGETRDANIASGKGWLHPALGGVRTLGSYLTSEDWRERAGIDRDRAFSGGLDTAPDSMVAALASVAQERVPRAHTAFLEGLPRLIETEEHIFVHAGIRPGVPLAEQVEDDLVWIREGFLDHPGDFGKLVIHGHTALDFPTHFGNRIDLDGGAGYGRPLVPAVWDGTDWFTLGDEGRSPLRPDVMTGAGT